MVLQFKQNHCSSRKHIVDPEELLLDKQEGVHPTKFISVDTAIVRRT